MNRRRRFKAKRRRREKKLAILRARNGPWYISIRKDENFEAFMREARDVLSI